MVGCEKDSFEVVKPVLEGMGKNVFHCGGPGTGEIAKICNNMMLGIQMIAVAEGISLGEKLGIDPKVLSQIVSVSTGRCWSNDVYNPRPGVLENVPASRNYSNGFQISLIRKDLSIALEAAEAAQASTYLLRRQLNITKTQKRRVTERKILATSTNTFTETRKFEMTD